MVRSNMKKMCLAILIVPVIFMPFLFGRGTGAYLPQVNNCLAETFQLAGRGRELFAERLQPFVQGRSGVGLHLTGVQCNGAACRVQGYIEGSALGEIRLPDDLNIVKEKGAWKWQGFVDSRQSE